MKHSRDGRGRLRRLSPCGRSHEAGARSDCARQLFYGKVRKTKEGRVGSIAPGPLLRRSWPPRRGDDYSSTANDDEPALVLLATLRSELAISIS